MMGTKRLLVVVVAVLLFVAVVPMVRASRAYAASSLQVPSQYATIQGALNAAAAGDTIVVQPGRYIENVDFGGKDVHLVSAGGAAATTIDGGYAQTTVTVGPAGELRGFTITGGAQDNGTGGGRTGGGGGVLVWGAGSLIRNNVFVRNKEDYGFAAGVGGDDASPMITANRFEGNSCFGPDGGDGVVHFSNHSSPVVTNNVFVNNPCPAISMGLAAGASPVVINNTIYGNDLGIYVSAANSAATHAYRNNILDKNYVGVRVDYLAAGGAPVFDNNLVRDSSAADYVGISNLTGTAGNVAGNPLFEDPSHGDFHLAKGSAAADAGSPTAAPTVDIEGTNRPLDSNGDGTAAFDIGAYELQPVAPDGVSYSNGVVRFEASQPRVSCNGGSVVFSPTYGGTPIACGAVTEFDITGWGASAGVVLNFSRAEFPNLATVNVNTGPGDDGVVLTDVATTVQTGSGHDTVHLGNGDYNIDTGPDNDVIAGGSGPGWRPGHVKADMGSGDDAIFTAFGELPENLISYPFPGGHALFERNSDWFIEATSLEHLHVWQGTPGGLEVIPSRTVDVGYQGNDLDEVVIDCRGLPLLGEPGNGAEYYSLPGFAAIAVSPTSLEQNVYIEDLRLLYFIDAVYKQLLGRPADDSGLLYWDEQLFLNNLPRSSFVGSVLQLPEHAGLAVDGAYQYILGRSPDAAGRAFWVSWIGQGHGLDALRAQLYASPEFFTTHGSTNSTFLDALYQDILHRAPDPSGKAYWLGQLDNGVRRSDVATVILGLDEPITVALTDLYSSLLGRSASPDELSYWRGVWHNYGEFGVTALIVGSNEYELLVAPIDPADPFYFKPVASSRVAAAKVREP